MGSGNGVNYEEKPQLYIYQPDGCCFGNCSCRIGLRRWIGAKNQPAAEQQLFKFSILIYFLFEISIFDPGNKLFATKHRRRVFTIKKPDKIFILLLCHKLFIDTDLGSLFLTDATWLKHNRADNKGQSYTPN